MDPTPPSDPTDPNAPTDPNDPNEILIRWLEHCFLRYQLRWILDDKRFLLGLKGRQLGFTDATAAACILGGFRDKRPQIVISAAQKNADALLDAIRAHCRFLAAIGLPAAADFEVDNSEKIVWKTGGSVIALAASARTGRSFHGDLYLDEFAYHLDAEALWAAAAPMATRGNWRVKVFSTPNGATGKFYELCQDADGGTLGERWSFHRISLDDAEGDGLEVDRGALLSLVGGDGRAFGEAYQCEFLDADLQYFPTELADAALKWRGSIPDLSGAEYFAGFDVGRHHDLSVLTVIGVVDTYRKGVRVRIAWVAGIFTAKRTAFRKQRKMIEAAREAFGWTRLLIDKGGLGEQLTEELVEEFGAAEVIPVAFTLDAKAAIATGAFLWFRDHRVRFPKDANGKQLHAETLAVRRKVTEAGNVTYVSPRTARGHGDHFWSFGLALMAASGPTLPRGMGDEPLMPIA